MRQPRCATRDRRGSGQRRLASAQRLDPYPAPQRKPPTIRQTLTGVDTPYESHIGYGALEQQPWEMHKTTFRRRGPHLGSFYSEAEDGEQFYTQPSSLLNSEYRGAYGPGAAQEVPRRQGLAESGADGEEDSEDEEADNARWRTDPLAPARSLRDL